MKFSKLIKLSMMLFAVLILTPQQVWACACCADDGEYRISTNKPGNFEIEIMKRIRFDEKANVFTGSADVQDVVKGITRPANVYSLTGSLAARTLRLTFREGGNLGALNLLLPPSFVSFGADVHDGPLGTGGGPVLYKEWRFQGIVNGDGVFRPGLTAPAKYFLVLQGRGNNCDNAEDFTHWRLEITGRKARYAFYGALAKPAP
jgi:hypothetical protein